MGEELVQHYCLGNLLQFVYNATSRLRNIPGKDACFNCIFKPDCFYAADNGEALCYAIPNKLEEEGLARIENG